jgi:hypothetical protein
MSLSVLEIRLIQGQGTPDKIIDQDLEHGVGTSCDMAATDKAEKCPSNAQPTPKSTRTVTSAVIRGCEVSVAITTQVAGPFEMKQSFGDVSKLGGCVEVKPQLPEVRKRNLLGSSSVSGLDKIERLCLKTLLSQLQMFEDRQLLRSDPGRLPILSPLLPRLNITLDSKAANVALPN